MDKKIHEFVVEEKKTPHVFEKRWLDHYVYTKIHEIFFASFLSELYEWITRLANSHGRCRLNQPIVWTPELVRTQEASKDKIARVVDH